MKYVQILFSPTGGTKKAAQIMASQWKAPAETIDLSDPKQDFSVFEFQPEDLVLFAVPSFGGRVPSLAAQRMKTIHGNSARCILLCVYGNRAYEDTLAEMEDLAKDCGFQVAAAVAAVAEHSIMHQYAAGRPDAEDTARLQEFSRRILEKLEKEDFQKEEKPFSIPGNRPYKKTGGSGMVPKARKTCTGCGHCAKCCPAEAIDPAHLETADPQKCISCMRCVAECPSGARGVNPAMVAAAALAMKKVCSVRKECELYL